MSKSSIPLVTVGIVSAQRIDFCLNGEYLVENKTVSGPQTVELLDGTLRWQGQPYRELLFSVGSPSLSDGVKSSIPPQSFTLNDVTIGNGFHWERRQQQTFLGSLRLIVDGEKIQTINELPVEDYLESVITSEMSVTSSLELLKAHAVISRSWLLYQKKASLNASEETEKDLPKDDELIRWYNREDHALFDVCADDHCQRYQGITSLITHQLSLPQDAVRQTRGQVLMYDGELCDTRFYKCCGGRTEEFQYCWEDTPKPYLQSVECHWCNTKDKDILRQVLNDYDQETTDFHDWTVEYTTEELTALVNDKLQADLGTVTDLIPLSRGKSGRIWRLQIVGTKRSVIIGKELEIRRVLSPTHLYSSNFEVEKSQSSTLNPQPSTLNSQPSTLNSQPSTLNSQPSTLNSQLSTLNSQPSTLNSQLPTPMFILRGHGWGHGVGLCQIGAAVMAHEGMTYRDILLHYYPGAEIKEIY